MARRWYVGGYGGCGVRGRGGCFAVLDGTDAIVAGILNRMWETLGLMGVSIVVSVLGSKSQGGTLMASRQVTTIARERKEEEEEYEMLVNEIRNGAIRE